MGACPSFSLLPLNRDDSPLERAAARIGPDRATHSQRPKGFPSLKKPLHCDRLVNYKIVTDYNLENNRIAA